MFGFFAGWPKISSYAYSDLLGKIHFWLSLIGFGARLVPQVVILAGIGGGMSDAAGQLHYWNLASSIGAYVFMTGFPVFVVNMALSLAQAARRLERARMRRRSVQGEITRRVFTRALPS